jgi:hypothetical protein
LGVVLVVTFVFEPNPRYREYLEEQFEEAVISGEPGTARGSLTCKGGVNVAFDMNIPAGMDTACMLSGHTFVVRVCVARSDP